MRKRKSKKVKVPFVGQVVPLAKPRKPTKHQLEIMALQLKIQNLEDQVKNLISQIESKDRVISDKTDQIYRKQAQIDQLNVDVGNLRNEMKRFERVVDQFTSIQIVSPGHGVTGNGVTNSTTSHIRRT